MTKLTASYKQLNDEQDLESIKANAVDKLVNASSSSSSAPAPSSGPLPVDLMRSIAADTVDELAEEVSLLRQLVADDIAALTQTIHESTLCPGTLITKSVSEKVHIVKAGPPAPSRRWRTFCGWRFVSSGFSTLPSDHVVRLKCVTCFKRASCQVPQPPDDEEESSRTATSDASTS